MESHCKYRDPLAGQCRKAPLAGARNGYCIFHARVEDKDEEEFREALTEYVNEIRTKKLDYSFVGFVFVGAIDFQKHLGVAVLENAEFRSAEFHGDVDFWETEFYGGAGFALAKFYEDAKFERVKFHGEVRFAGTEFKYVSFRETEFYGEARFNGTSFRKKAGFLRTRFEGGADFERVVFGGYAEFDKAQFWPTSRISVALAKGRLSFAGTNLENVSLTPLKLDRSASIDFTGALLRNTQMKREDIEGNIADEREKHFSKAGEIYLLLKNNFYSVGRYADESWAFTKEKDMERRSFWHFRKEHKLDELGKELIDTNLGTCLFSILVDHQCTAKYFYRHLAKYVRRAGVSALRADVKRMSLYTASFVRYPAAGLRNTWRDFVSFVKGERAKTIGSVTRRGLYRVLKVYVKYVWRYSWSTVSKWLYRWGEWPQLIIGWCGVTIFIFSLIYRAGNIVSQEGTLVTSYLDKLYFSGITFTTLGFGGYSPAGGLRFWAFLESFLGVFFIALFVFSFARRTAGR